MAAGALEILWMIALRYSEGFTRLWPTLLVFILGALSLYMMSLVIRTIPAGTAYAIWTGMGAAGIAVVGILFFQEPRHLTRILSIVLIIAGIAGLKLTSTDS